ncbi:MAG: type IV pilus assembly [Geobacteraceae bacterium]|nr:MAG: type IV pilus assembly [Geobacteraceae bacterium]
MREVRKFTRVPFKSEVLINAQGENLKGESENLSLYGLFVRIDKKLEINTRVEVMIPLHTPPEDAYMDINGVVARQDENGVGIKFQQIGVDAFINLKNIVSYQCGSEDQVMEEFYSYIAHKDQPVV